MSNSVNLSLDVTKTGIQNPLIKVRQGDGGFETLRTTVTANGEPMDLQGWTITFMGTTAGNHKIVDGNIKVVEAPNGIFDYTPSKAWGMDIGEFKIAYFKFVKGDGSASSANFRVNVIEAVDLTQEEAKNYISVVDTTIAEINQHLTGSLANVTQSIAATSSAASSLSVKVSSAVNQVNSAASSASSVASSAASNVKSVAASAASYISINDAQLVHKTGTETIAGDKTFSGKTTFSGNIKASQVTATDLLYGFRNVIPVPSTTTKVIDLINNEFIKGMDFWKEATYIAFGTTLSDAPTNDVYSIIKLATRGANRTYVEYSDLSGNVWHTTATNNTLNPWVKQANDNDVVHKSETETIAGDKTFTGTVNAAQKIYTRTIGSTNDLQIIYTRVGNVVTGRYTAAKSGVFTLSNNDGYKAPTEYPVNVIAQNINAWFTTDNRFSAPDGASQGNFMFITSDPLPAN